MLGLPRSFLALVMFITPAQLGVAYLRYSNGSPASYPMKRTFLHALLVLPLLFSACKKEDPEPPQPPAPAQQGTLRLRFVPLWEGEPFLPFVEHTNISNYRVQVEKLQFYVSAMGAVNGNDTVALTAIDLVNFNNGPVERSFTMAPRTFSSITMGLGVPEEPNHSDPALYNNAHPLSVTNGMHWNWTSGYIFMKFEGRYDLDPNGTGAFPNTFSIHPGFDVCYTTVDIYFAVDRFFHSPIEGVIDLETENLAHGSNLPLALKLIRNVAASISVE
jgi:hypothetical protein